jgi:multidrug efflux pump subunit AcrA (membrane-fusion protein)
MDIPRTPRRRRRNLVLIGLGAALALGVPWAAVMAAKSSSMPQVAARSIRTATVVRAPMIREIEAPGSLVAQDVRWVTASARGRVDRILVEPGAAVQADTVLFVLDNPDLELAALEAEGELAAARAELANLGAQLETDKISQRVTVATVESEQADARRIALANQQLADSENIARADLERSRERAQEVDERLTLEQRRLAVIGRARKAQIDAQAARVDRLAAVVRFRREQIAGLAVTAGSIGVLREVPVELGQWVDPGATLATVVQPERLEAELRIPEIRAKDIRLGQLVRIDMRTATIAGEVARIDPAPRGGSVLIDVRLTEALPDGARPDLTVDGVIELERIDDTVQVRRPPNVESGTRVGLFALGDDGIAERVPVTLGRASMDAIEITDGLAPGDVVIVSDITAWDDVDRLRVDP